ncbi:MAG: hypothetical protein U1A78_31335 [Polyangia bacterium]
MSRAPAPAPPTRKPPGPTGQQPAPEAVRCRALEPSSPPSRRPAPLPGHSLSGLPLFAGGSVPGSPAAASGPQFFDAQAFSPAVARHAVRSAAPGRFPFGDRIAAETRGAIDPHTVPSVVVDKLPGLGVCQDGKVALRKGSGIDVARHELAHALGGDEATAQRASRDPGVLRSLSEPQASQAGEPGAPGPTGEPAERRPPVNGWAIGFEFQTHGASNPKTFEKRIERGPVPELADNEQQDEQQDGEERLGPILSETYRPLDGLNGSQLIYRPRLQDWKVEIDSGDIEIITRAQPETNSGRENLERQLDEIAVEMKRVQDEGKKPGYKKYQAAGDKEVYVQHGCGNKTFGAHPQATVGLNFEAVPELISQATSQQQIDHPYMPKKIWAENQMGFDWTHPSFKNEASLHGMTHIRASQQQVDAALSQHADLSKLPRLRAVLQILASYAALGTQIQTSKTPQVKNVAAFMSRSNLHEVYKIMSPLEKRTYKTLLAEQEGDGSMAAAFGLASLDALRATKLLRKDAMNWGQYTLFDILDNLPERDLFGQNDSQKSIHKVDDTTYRTLLTDATSQFDIGTSSAQGQVQRKGLFMELRAIKREVPWTQWKVLALSIFDQVRRLNAAVDTQKDQQHQQQQLVQQRQRQLRGHVPELVQQHEMQRAQQHRQRMQEVHALVPARAQQAAESLAVRQRLLRARQNDEQSTRALLNRPPPLLRRRGWFHNLP